MTEDTAAAPPEPTGAPVLVEQEGAVRGTGRQVPLVDYLVLGDPPHLLAQECVTCAARFFDRRNGCASCGGRGSSRTVEIDREGELRTFTIVSFAAPGIPVPFVAVVDCGGTSVRANVVNVPADPDHVQLGMSLRLVTYSIGTDEAGTEAIGFGFEPAT